MLYSNRFNKFIKKQNLMNGEEFRQFARVPYWFVSNYGRCVSVYRKPKWLTPSENYISKAGEKQVRWYHYRLPKNCGGKDIKIHRLVAEVFPDLVNMDALPMDLPLEKCEVHHIQPFDPAKGPYENSRADNLQVLLPQYHRELTRQKEEQRIIVPIIEKLKTEPDVIVSENNTREFMFIAEKTKEGRHLKKIGNRDILEDLARMAVTITGVSWRVRALHDSNAPDEKYFWFSRLLPCNSIEKNGIEEERR